MAMRENKISWKLQIQGKSPGKKERKKKKKKKTKN